MAHAAKVLAQVSKSAVSVSTKLSIAAVIGLAVLPVLPHDAATRGATIAERDAAPIELVRAKTLPFAEGMQPADPAIQLVARRSRSKRERPVETDEAEPRETGSASAKARAEHKTSTISPPAQAPEAAAKPAVAAEPKPEEALAAADRTRPRHARVPTARELAHKGPIEKSEHTGKVSSIAPPEPQKSAVPAPETKPETKTETGSAEPPKPEVWTDAEVIAGLRECVKLLAPIAAEVEISLPVKAEKCGAPAPVLVKRVGSGAHRVEINPPAVLNCAMVVGLHQFVEKTLQPAAKESLGSPIARLRNASGYVCRNRVGSLFGADRLSEHALANAIDIAGFITADGRSIDVARFWGPTARDQREAERVAAAHAKEGKGADKDGKGSDRSDPRREPGHAPVRSRKISAIAHAGAAEQPKDAKDAARGRKGRAPVQTAELHRLGKGASDASADPKAIPAMGTPQREEARKSVEAQFLRRLHTGACGVFGTVLGPEANEAHRDHFHFDLAPRRRSAYCQ
jgi:hypothetical protein